MRGRVRLRVHGSVEPDINVTPLVDIVLVLLIIFMVVTPQMEQDVPVELPGIFNPDPDVKLAVDPIKVSIAKAGEFFINDKQYDLEGAVEYLSLEHAVDPNRRLVLRADWRLKYGDVRQIFARTQELGFPGVSLLVGEKHRAGEETEAGAPPAPAVAAPEGQPAADQSADNPVPAPPVAQGS